jgi:ketosteroid isomerase-like protein
MANSGADETAVRAANEAFYKALSAGSIEGISAACAQDEGVTVLHEASKEVAVGWPAVLDTWKEIPFDTFSELSVAASGEVIKVHGPFAWVAGLEKVRGKMKDGQNFSFTALATNIYEKREGRWLIVHHHASKAAENIVG